MQTPVESFWSEIKSYEERLQNNPASYCFSSLAEVYLKAGLHDDALAVARAGVARYPGFAAGQMALARVCHQLGLMNECRQALEVVTGAVPNHADAQRLLAQLYLDAGQEQEATCSLQALLDFYPDDTAAQLELESIHRKFAEKSVEEDLELIEFTEADIVEELGVGDQLVERCKPAVPFTQDPWSGIDNTDLTGAGTALSPELESVWSEPEQQIASVFERTEQDPLSTPTLAELYVEQGFPDKAIGIYHKILAGDPLNQAAAARIADLVSSSTPLKDGQVLSALDDEQPAAPVNDADLEVGAQRSMVTILEGWLENIRGLRTCH